MCLHLYTCPFQLYTYLCPFSFFVFFWSQKKECPPSSSRLELLTVILTSFPTASSLLPAKCRHTAPPAPPLDAVLFSFSFF